jgi:hypothetical protein
MLKVGDVVKLSEHALRPAREFIWNAWNSRVRAVGEIDFEVQRDRLGIIVEVDPSPYAKGYGVVWVNPPDRFYRDGRPYSHRPFYSSTVDYRVEAA